jgi:polyisoprenoid-binding protein YceI
VAERPEDSRAEATIDMGSVDSGDTTRDDHLRSGDLFDIERHPTATFKSTGLDWAGTAGTLTGDLTIKGITRPIDLRVAFLGALVDPWGNERAVFEARGRINREDYDVTWNMVLESGGLLVSKEIDLICNIEFIRS